MKAKIFIGPPRSGKSRVAEMIMECIGKEKTSYINARRIKDQINRPFFFFNELHLDVNLIIFDDCDFEFDYTFFQRAKRELNGQLFYSIEWCHRGHRDKIIDVKNIIFTTNEIDPKWLTMPWFIECFDIIEFPLA